MTPLPEEPEAFAEQVLILLNRLKPELNAELTGPTELVVDGRRLDLDNLMRLVKTDHDRGLEIVEQYLDHLFDDDTFAAAMLPWDVAKAKIMPRIQPSTIFEHLCREQVAHVPWVNNTVIVFVIDLPHMTVSVTTEQMMRWGVTPDELDLIARANLDHATPHFELRSLESEDGGQAMLLTFQDGYDASRLLIDGLHATLAPELGETFYAAAPSRDMLLAFSGVPQEFVDRICEKIREDFQRLPYPITPELFVVCRDGVAGTARLADDQDWRLAA
ncbi:MAG: DUF1444 family protein [Phycisphaerales bacterium]